MTVDSILIGDAAVPFLCTEVRDGKLAMVSIGHRQFDTQDFAARNAQVTTLREAAYPSFLRPLALEKHGRTEVLTMEPPAGVHLSKLVRGGAVGIQEALQLTLRLTDAVDQFHQAGLSHGRLSPASVFVRPSDGRVQIALFPESLRQRPHSHSEGPERARDEMAFLAPEQTGRVARLADNRADLYAIGAILFSLIEGRAPFGSMDQMDLLHQIIATRPPQAVTAPNAVRAMIERLMAKDPAERYQTAWGVAQDLRKCLQLSDTGEIVDFVIGADDRRATFAIPNRLFGREADLKKLREFRSEASGGASLALVGGFSGAGKSALVQACLADASAQKAITISGKYDQLQSLPYKAIIEALRGFVQRMLSVDPNVRDVWRANINARVGESLDTLVSFLPELALIVGDRPEPARLDPSEREERFQLAISGMFETLGTPDTPAVLFLDDLQWADSASFKVIENILTSSNTHNLTIFGAFRSNEVGAQHPLRKLVADLSANGVALHEVEVEPLGPDAISEMLEATLAIDRSRTAELVPLLRGKTLGNPFHLRQLLTSLYERGALSFDRQANRWAWEIDRIREQVIDGDIAQLLAVRIERLSEEARAGLSLAACFGAEFTVDMLGIVDGRSQERRRQGLEEAAVEGLIVYSQSGDTTETWTFSHDRVQEAAYARLDGAEARFNHARIAETLMKDIKDPYRDSRLFTALDHAALGLDFIVDPVSGRRFTELVLVATEKAKSLAAYDLARRYLGSVASMPRALSCTDWETNFDVAYQLEMELLETNFLAGGWERARPHFDTLIERSPTKLKKAAVHHMMVSLFAIVVDFPRALDHASKASKLLGVDIAGPYGPKIGLALGASFLKQRKPENFNYASLPAMSDERTAQAIDVLMTAATPAFLSNADQFVLIAMRMYNLTMSHGLTEAGALAISNYAIVVYIAFDSVDRAYAIQQRLAELFDQREFTNRVRARVTYNRAMVLDAYMEPHAAILAKLDSHLELSRQAADREYVGYYHFGRLRYLFALGRPLSEIEAALEGTERVGKQLRHETLLGLCASYRRIIAAATSNSTGPLWTAEDKDHEATLVNEPNRGSFYAAMFLLAIMDEDFGLASDMQQRLASLANYTRTGPDYGEILLLSAILFREESIGAAAAKPKKFEKDRLAIEKKLATLAEKYPTNTAHLGAILRAMKVEESKGAAAASAAYDEAIRACRDIGKPHYAALAADLAARGAAKAGLAAERSRRLQEAKSWYDMWGGTRRSAHISLDVPDAIETPTLASASVDVAAIARAAQAIFESLDFGTLLRRLLTLAIQNAGADRGALYVMSSGEPALAADAQRSKGQTIVTLSPELKPLSTLDPEQYPVTIVAAAMAKGRHVLIDDASQSGEFVDCRYLGARKPRSVMCLPVMRSGAIEALLYLENSLSPHVFTPARRDVLETLAGLAAISLVNARLFSEQEEALRLERSATEELARLSRLKDEFLANTSHELRTPLNGIIGLAGSLADGAKGVLPPEAVETLLMLESSGRRLEALVSDILDFSTLRAGALELKAAPVNLRSVVDLVATLLSTKARSVGVNIRNEVPEDLTAIADENRLEQILINLIDNAIKFGPNGDATISAEIKGDRIEVAVSDKGVGVPPEDRDRIFQSFEQGDASIAREQEGVGLGLAIVSQLVKLHGGQVRVEDNAGAGSRFVFDIARGNGRPAHSLSRTIKSIAPRFSPDRTDRSPVSAGTFRVMQADRKGMVLVVDDDDVNLQVLRNYLGLSGFEAVTATSGAEALGLLQDGLEPDAILLDIMMPKMSGYEVCRRIREHRSPSRLPIVMLTAKNRAEDLAMAYEQGANDYLTKPFIKEELLARVRSHADLSRTNAAYERFVPTEFLTFLNRERITDIALGDNVARKMTIMFTDIRNFTGLTEKMTSAESFDFLIDYFASISPSVYAQGGFLNQYSGDGMMALFPAEPEAAVLAAISIQKTMDQFNTVRGLRNKTRINTGIGLHTGDLVLGIIGHEQRRTGNVVSDAVNLAARIENLTAFYGVRIAVSKAILDNIPDPQRFPHRELDVVRVKGKREPVSVFEVFAGDAPDMIDAKTATLDTFHRGVAAFRAGSFGEAQGLFETVLKNNPEDSAADCFRIRSLQFLKKGAPEGWDGVVDIGKTVA